MCIQQKQFYNKWTKHFEYRKCGKCPACLQEKANKRTQRINNAVYDGYVTLFCTFTFRNINIPYIKKSELHENIAEIPIYRDCTVRRVRVTGNYSMAYKYIRKTVEIGRIDCHKYHIYPNKPDVQKLSKLRGQSDPDKVGVLFFKDLQDFFKRLRTNLARRYGVTKPIYSFNCSELGPTTQRPHFHALISVPKESLAECQSAIVESWPYDSRIKSAQSIQIARNAASYVSSYVNRGADFPRFMDNKALRPKHSFSKGYGSSNPAFTLEKILGSLRNGDLRYIANPDAASSSQTVVMYPAYAYNRYFAKFYGFGRLSYDEILELVRNPVQYFQVSDLLPRFYRKTIPDRLHHTLSVTFTDDYDFDFDKMNTVIRQINRQYLRFIRDFVYYEDGRRYQGLPDNVYSRELYADYLYKFWKCFSSTVIKQQYDNISYDWQIPQLFDNLDEVYSKGIRSDVLALDSQHLLWKMSDPNLFDRNIQSTVRWSAEYHRKYKRRKITNRVMCDNKFNV